MALRKGILFSPTEIRSIDFVVGKEILTLKKIVLSGIKECRID